jgi:hypothetical protein
VDAAAALRVWIAVAGHGDQAVDEVERLASRIGYGKGVPSQLVGRGGLFAEVAGQPAVARPAERLVLRRRADPVEPGAAVVTARGGERRAGDLLGVEPVGTLLRRVASHRECTRQGLGGEFVAEAGLVVERLRDQRLPAQGLYE